MGNFEPPVNFCDGCIFADGVQKSGTLLVRTAGATIPNPGMELQFVDEEGSTTHTVKTGPLNDWNSSGVNATESDVIERVRGCDAPVNETKKRFGIGGILGSKTVQACGAFPGQNPKKPVVEKPTDYWFY